MKYDYYLIELPGDLFPPCSDGKDCTYWHRCMAVAAIDEAKEHTRLYWIPADWTAKHIKGEPGDWTVVFRVRRRRN